MWWEPDIPPPYSAEFGGTIRLGVEFMLMVALYGGLEVNAG